MMRRHRSVYISTHITLSGKQRIHIMQAQHRLHRIAFSVTVIDTYTYMHVDNQCYDTSIDGL